MPFVYLYAISINMLNFENIRICVRNIDFIYLFKTADKSCPRHM